MNGELETCGRKM